MTAEFGEPQQLFKVNGRSLKGEGRVDRGQPLEPVHPLIIDTPINPTAEERALVKDDLTLGLDYLGYVYYQEEDHSTTIGARIGNLRFD